MRILLYGVGGIVILVAALWIAGSLLPVAHVASGSRVIARSADDVYKLVSDVERYSTWWPEVTRTEIVSREPDGRVRFRQEASGDTVLMEIVELQPPRRMVTRIADPEQPFGGTWTFEIEPEGSSTRLTITERGEVYNPIFRFLGRFVLGHTGTIESFLGAAERSAQ